MTTTAWGVIGGVVALALVVVKYVLSGDAQKAKNEAAFQAAQAANAAATASAEQATQAQAASQSQAADNAQDAASKPFGGSPS